MTGRRGQKSGGANRKPAAEKIAEGARGHRRIADDAVGGYPPRASREPPPDLTPAEAVIYAEAAEHFPGALPTMIAAYARAVVLERLMAPLAATSAVKFRQWMQAAGMARSLHAELARLAPQPAAPKPKSVTESQGELMAALLDDQRRGRGSCRPS